MAPVARGNDLLTLVMDLPQTAPGVPAPGIDPTPSELEQIGSIANIFEWLGAASALQDALFQSLGGGTPRIRDIVFIRGNDWDQVVAAIRLPVPSSSPASAPTPSAAVAGTEGDDGSAPTQAQASAAASNATRAPTAIEFGHLAMVRRIARLRSNLTAVEQLPGAGAVTTDVRGWCPMAGAPTPPGTTADAAASVEPAVKLSAILDPTIDAPLVRIKPQEVRRLFSCYKETQGAEPAEDVAPTEEQLSAVTQTLDCDRFPYACFSIFGPYGKRMLIKMVYLAYLFMPDGSWQKRELPGPPSYEHWWVAFRVFRVTLLLLKAVPPELLDNYVDMVKRFSRTYGQSAWFIVYQAEVRMRSEHFERLRRQAERTHDLTTGVGQQSDFDPNMPWATVFAMAVGEQTRSWWEDNLHRHAMLFLTRVHPASLITDDGTVQPALEVPASLSVAAHTEQTMRSPSVPNAQKKRKASNPPPQGRATNNHEVKFTADVYTKKGVMFCNFYNDGDRCNFSGRDCNNAHACKQCKQLGHPQSNCPRLGGDGSQRKGQPAQQQSRGKRARA